MAARNACEKLYSMNRESFVLTGKCVGAGAANPTGKKGIGVSTVTRTATGKYTITLEDKWAALLSLDLQVIDSTGANQFTFNIVSETVASTKTINITVFKSATAAAPAIADLATTDTLLFKIWLSNSQQLPKPF